MTTPAPVASPRIPSPFVELPKDGAQGVAVHPIKILNGPMGIQYFPGMTCGLTVASALSLIVNGLAKAYAFDAQAFKAWESIFEDEHTKKLTLGAFKFDPDAVKASEAPESEKFRAIVSFMDSLICGPGWEAEKKRALEEIAIAVSLEAETAAEEAQAAAEEAKKKLAAEEEARKLAPVLTPGPSAVPATNAAELAKLETESKPATAEETPASVPEATPSSEPKAEEKEEPKATRRGSKTPR